MDGFFNEAQPQDAGIKIDVFLWIGCDGRNPVNTSDQVVHCAVEKYSIGLMVKVMVEENPCESIRTRGPGEPGSRALK